MMELSSAMPKLGASEVIAVRDTTHTLPLSTSCALDNPPNFIVQKDLPLQLTRYIFTYTLATSLGEKKNKKLHSTQQEILQIHQPHLFNHLSSLHVSPCRSMPPASSHLRFFLYSHGVACHSIHLNSPTTLS